MKRVQRWLRHAPGWVSSLLLHAALLIILALITVAQQLRDPVPELLAIFGERQEEQIDETFELVAEDLNISNAKTSELALDISDSQSKNDFPLPINAESEDEPSEETELELSADAAPAQIAQDLSGRTKAGRANLIAQEGGTPASEAAVTLGLQWLARHQKRDGSWSFDHQKGPCRGRCGNPGSLKKCASGATGLALLSFLGAGHSPDSGEYKSVVRRGVKYLVRMVKKPKGGVGNLANSFQGNQGLYAQGIGTLALCEAYSMTHDAKLREPAQQAIDFIVRNQDTRGGGWRYKPRSAGDTSVVGWQVMALHSGTIAELNVPPHTLEGAWAFLDSVQSEGGVAYGYTNSFGARPSLSAVGLLSRMYLGQARGWHTEHPVIVEGSDRLADIGPSRDDMYYNYYATQYMYQVGGDNWTSWNSILRDRLVNLQKREGHPAGSWNPTCPHGARPGGRLYMTAMCVLTLEVYYRHLPIYERRGVAPADDAAKVE